MKRLFEIQTLSDGGTQVDPVTILTGSMAVLTQIFPGLFTQRQPVTRDTVDKIFPGNGYWTVLLKNFLLEHTAWTVDMRYWYPFENQAGYIQDFAYSHRMEYAPTCPDFANCAWPKFQEILRKEKLSGGNQPVGQYPGGLYSGGIDFTTLALFGGGLALLFALSKKKKRR